MTSRSSFKAALKDMEKARERSKWQPPRALGPEALAAAQQVRLKRKARIAARVSPDFEAVKGYF